MSDFYRGRKVVVTGGAGFLGQHLCRLLRDAGAEVLALDDASRGHTYLPGVRYDLSSAAEPMACERVFADAFAVFNLAAVVAGVLYNQQHQLEMYAGNARLQTVPVQVASMLGIPHFLQVSSVCVYAPGFNAPCREPDGMAAEPVGANNGYSWAKRMGEKAVAWSALPHAVIVRPSNLYGPGDYYDDRAHVIPALIRKALAEPAVKVNGSGAEMREFLYVEDAARGMMAALEHGRHGHAYNLGTNGATCLSISGILEFILRETGQADKQVIYSREHDAGDRARWSACDKIEAETPWRHEIDLETGIRRTVEDARTRLNL